MWMRRADFARLLIRATKCGAAISRRRTLPRKQRTPRIFLARARAMLKISFDRLLRDTVRIPA
jgi:hypothetical protein